MNEYERELSLVRWQFKSDGLDDRRWKEMDNDSRTMLSFLGFSSAYQVWRLANKYGKRVCK